MVKKTQDLGRDENRKPVKANEIAEKKLAELLPNEDPEQLKKEVQEQRDKFILKGRKRQLFYRATPDEMKKRKTGRLELNTQQEAYCRLRVEGYDKTRAYIKAYGNVTTPGQSGWILEQKDYIKARIKQLQEERALAAKIVDPEESLARWNDIYQQAALEGDRKGMIEAQKQIDKINGAEKSIINIHDSRTLFSNPDEADWKKDAQKLLQLLSEANPKVH